MYGNPKFQYYKKGEAFYGDHFDALNSTQIRVVAYITYLNTLTDGGGTYFTHQDYTVQPIKGKTVLPTLISKFSPNRILSSTTGGDATFTGFLSKLFTINGSMEEAALEIPNEISYIHSEIGTKYLLKPRKTNTLGL